MNSTSRSYPPGDLRVSDSDRDAALAELSEHFQAGRLTAAELDDRAGRALAARTGRELDDLMSDLPSAPSASPARAGTNSGADTGSQRTGAGPAVRSTAVALAAIGSVTAIVAILGNGHWHGGSAPWGLILVVFIILRRRARRSRSHRGE